MYKTISKYYIRNESAMAWHGKCYNHSTGRIDVILDIRQDKTAKQQNVGFVTD